MIEFSDVSFTYPYSGAAALRNISLSIDEGIYLLLGENGAGKTTFLHLAASLLLPSSGCVTINGSDSRDRKPSTLRSVFFTADDTEMPADTISTLARLHGRVFYPRFDSAMLDENLAAFGINPSIPLSSMSLGQRKKAIAAYALALRADILLLDEPANGLDIGSRDILRSLMARCVEPGQTVIVSTHTTADLQPLFDGIIMLRQSNLLFCNTTAHIASRLGFGIYNIPPREALFTMNDIGRFRSIVPADPLSPSEIDIHLLYSSMYSPESRNILNIINT
ncbi:MAG: ABC transporter ATP-binding protein [Paramuribaculum sp.]|jgi:ABC-2 type transport system ATP-binding protein|uniref:ATP-binding cassette domain-containing protein n=1 Tax=Duncaniella dubosii TaxID=2518971 RepID=UPI0035286BCB